MPSNQPPWNNLLEDRFLFKAEAGSGSFCRVFQVWDDHGKQLAAVKVLHRLGAAKRFQREISFLKKICHPNVVRYIHDGSLPDGMPYLAMEWLSGKTLAQVLQTPDLGLGETVSAIAQAAEGLGELHQLGIVHRDLKPSNIQIHQTGSQVLVKVIDLGIAKSDIVSTITKEGALMGTPAYMSPELAATEKKITPAADVYSLCAVMYHLICGRQVYEAKNLWELIGKILFQTPLPPSHIVQDLPEGLEEIMLKGLAREPGQRFNDGKELARALNGLEISSAAMVTGQITATQEIPRASKPKHALNRYLAVLLCELLPPPEPQSITASQMMDRCKEAITQQGGSAHQLPGYRVLGVFGQGRSYGDEAARALLAGLAISKVFRTKTAVTLSQFGRNLNPTVALGRAANLLKGKTISGSIYTDDAVARRAEGRFQIKQDKQGYRVSGYLGWIGMAQSEIIGRNPQRQQLQTLLQQTVKTQKPGTAIILGNEGMGKSILCAEVCALAARQGIKLAASDALAGSKERPYSLAAQLLRLMAGIANGLSATFTQKMLNAFLEPFGNQGKLLATVCQDSELPRSPLGADATRWRIWEAFAAVLSKTLEKGPLLWLADDLHRGDLMSRNLLYWLIRAQTGPFFFIATMPPDAWAEEKTKFDMPEYLNQITLPPLERVHAAELLRKHFPGLEQDARDQIAVNAAGNPFFMLELGHACHKGLSGFTITQTIGMAIQAMLDRHRGPASAAAKAASVLGNQGSMKTLQALTGDIDLAACRQELIEAGIWRPTPVPVSPQTNQQQVSGGFRFQFQLMQQGVYQLLTPREKSELHREAGHHFENQTPKDPLRAAGHFANAGEREAVIRCLLAAASLAHGAADGETTLSTCNRLLQLDLSAGQLRQAKALRAQALTWLGQLSSGYGDVTVILEDSNAPARQRAEAACLGCLQMRRQSKPLEGLRLANIAVVEATITMDSELLAKALFHCAFAHYDAGEIMGIRECMERIAELGQQNPVIVAYGYEVEVLVANSEAAFERAHFACRKALEANCRIENHNRISANTANAGLALIALGRYREALPFLQSARKLYQRKGNRLEIYDTMINEGRALGFLGDYGTALQLLENAFKALQASGETHFSGLALAISARHLAARNQESDRQKAMEIVLTKLNPPSQSPIHALEQAIAIMEVCLVCANAGDAIPTAQFVLSLLEKHGDDNEFSSEALALAALVLSQTRTAGAQQAIAKAHRRIHFLYTQCREKASKEAILQAVDAHQLFLEQFPLPQRASG